MRIESEVARQSRYGDDAIEAFNTAVDNGQARLAMSILVDIVNAFAEKLDELTGDSLSSEKNIKTNEKEEIRPADTQQEKKDDSKQKQPAKEEPKSTAKEETSTKA